MATTTYSIAKAVSNTDYLPAFIDNADRQSWPWSKICTKKKTGRGSEQMFSWAGLPPSRSTEELGEVHFADIAELPATTWTVGKYTIGSAFSDESIEDNQHLPDLMSEAGTFMGQSQAYAQDQAAAYPFNNAFSAYTVFDSVALCGTHSMRSGDAFDNVLTTASLTYDNLWAGVNKFETTIFSQAGHYLKDTPKYVLYHPSKEKQWQVIRQTSNVPGTANNDKNTLQDYNLVGIPCRHLSTTTNWFILGEQFPKDYIWFTRYKPRTKWDKDFVHGAVLCKSEARFAREIRNFTHIFGNAGS